MESSVFASYKSSSHPRGSGQAILGPSKGEFHEVLNVQNDRGIERFANDQGIGCLQNMLSATSAARRYEVRR
jgi:hypothetical protein